MQTLLRERLFDRLDLWVHPIVLASGRRSRSSNRRYPVRRAPRTYGYGLADGTPATGT